jgi:glycosyltransferase involved in cell wall biosynthesis
MTKKIALFLPSLRGGGAERVMVDLANAFSRKGLDVDLVLANLEGDYQSMVLDSVNIIDLSSSRLFFSLPKLIKYIRKYSPDVLLSTMPHVNIIAVLSTLLARKKNKIYVREANTVSVAFSKLPKSKRFFWRLMMRIFYNKANAIIAPSLGVARDLEHILALTGGSVKTIYNPVVTTELIPLSKIPVEHKWFDNHVAPVILSVGRLTLQKDYPTLLKAFKIVHETMDAKLLILGEGEDRFKLEEMIEEMCLSDSIELYGFAANPFKFMKSADLFVLSSLWEGLPNSLIQAMACGCQVVSTDCQSGPSEILQNGRYGALVPIGDEVELAAKMLSVLTNDGSRHDVVERSSFFDVETSVDAYLELMFK